VRIAANCSAGRLLPGFGRHALAWACSIQPETRGSGRTRPCCLAKIARNLARSRSGLRAVAGLVQHAPVELQRAELAVDVGELGTHLRARPGRVPPDSCERSLSRQPLLRLEALRCAKRALTGRPGAAYRPILVRLVHSAIGTCRVADASGAVRCSALATPPIRRPGSRWYRARR